MAERGGSRAGLPSSFACGTIHVRDARTLPFRQSLAPLRRQSRLLAVENRLGPADRERFAEVTRLDGDLAGLKRLHDANGRNDVDPTGAYEALFRRLIVDRNHLMAHRFHLLLRRGGALVAVGALHLYGARSLLALIAGQGYQLQRLML